MGTEPGRKTEPEPRPLEGDSADLDSIVVAAEAELGEIAQGYQARLLEAVREMRRVFASAGDKLEALNELHGLAHNVKGQAGSFGYPLVSRVAASLCGFIAANETRAMRRLDVIRAHLDAIEVVANQGIRGEGGELGQQLLGALEGAIAQSPPR